MPEIASVFEKSLGVCGLRKVLRQLRREGHDPARCTVARLMGDMGLRGVIRTIDLLSDILGSRRCCAARTRRCRRPGT
jgi:putative transposase